MNDFFKKMKDFEFTSASGKNVPLSKLGNDRIIFDLLNENLSIKDYSDKIKTIFFIYQAFDPNSPARKVEDFKRFRRKTNVMELYLTLDYYKFLKATKTEALQMMSKLYLMGIVKFLKRKDFDYASFYNDVQNLFITNKLIPDKKETDKSKDKEKAETV